MDEDQVTQPQDIPVTHNAPYILIFIAVLLVAIGLGVYVWLARTSSLADSTVIVEPFVVPTSVPLPTLPQLPTIGEGFSQYTNEEFKFGFNYPKNYTISECPDAFCLSIPSLTLEAMILETYIFDPDDPINSIKANDLYCSSDFPTQPGSVSCNNTQVVPYRNPQGAMGYKVTRTKTVSGKSASLPAGIYNEVSYIFLLSTLLRGTGSHDYQGIMFSLKNSNVENNKQLEAIANSYFNF